MFFKTYIAPTLIVNLIESVKVFMKREDNDQHENLCDLEKAAEISSKLKCYELPDGTKLNLSNDHFNEMVDLFRILRKWRDECNKTKK